MRENYGIEVPLDFNYYPRGQWDEEDSIINGWRIDIKGTRRGGRWMLIEWNKLNFRQRDNNLSHIFMMFTVDWDRDRDQPTGLVIYEGAASLSKFTPDCDTTLVLKKGDPLPGTGTHLQADNYGIKFRDLNSNLDEVVAYVQKQSPPAWITDNFRNPYTGQTTREMLGLGATKPVPGTKIAPAAEPQIVHEVPTETIKNQNEGWLSKLLKRIKEWFS